jgi:hypothetical protein
MPYYGMYRLVNMKSGFVIRTTLHINTNEITENLLGGEADARRYAAEECDATMMP